MSSPLLALMSAANSTKLDLFYCSAYTMLSLRKIYKIFLQIECY